jgi:hypothetical protein
MLARNAVTRRTILGGAQNQDEAERSTGPVLEWGQDGVRPEA